MVVEKLSRTMRAPAWGGPPSVGQIDGTIVPWRLPVLRNIRAQYPEAWLRYGFVDAFNPLTNWYSPAVIVSIWASPC
jgi:hypothetical protein